jgi:DNA-binding response OmpR family regulator
MITRKILVVEDDADVRLGYGVLLKANRYDTSFAIDAVSAMSETRKKQPDLIILDLGIPAGDGFVVLDRLKTNAAFRGIPVIVVSARDVNANKERALLAGARAFVQKPWNDAELLTLISHLVEQDATGKLEGSADRTPASMESHHSRR